MAAWLIGLGIYNIQAHLTAWKLEDATALLVRRWRPVYRYTNKLTAQDTQNTTNSNVFGGNTSKAQHAVYVCIIHAGCYLAWLWPAIIASVGS